MRALIIDDVTTDRMVASAYFERLGFEVVVANDGKEAIRLFEKSEFAVLVTDYRMPAMFGNELIQQIREIEKRLGLAPCYIISFSTDLSIGVKTDLFSAGANEVMQKPIRLVDIRNSLVSAHLHIQNN